MGDNATAPSDYGLSASFRFWSYLVLNTGSVLCTLFVLYHLLFDRALRRALHNHIVIILLIVGLIYELTDIPWILYANYTGQSMFSGETFYLIWIFVDLGVYAILLGLFAWATVQRHILIFHDRWISTKKRRLIVHYGPMFAIIIYHLIYWTLIQFVLPCGNDSHGSLDSGLFIPCLFNKSILGTWDLIFNQVIPIFTIVVFSIGLIVRVVLQKRRLNQQMKWRRHRKMMIQLISLTSLYVVFNLPWVALILSSQFGLSHDIFDPVSIYLGYFFYYVVFFFPFACCASLSELRQKCSQCFGIQYCQRRTTPGNIVASTSTKQNTPGTQLEKKL